MATIIKWGNDPNEWRSKESKCISFSQEYNEMATSTQLIEKTQTGADMSMDVKENNSSSNNAIKEMFDQMRIGSYTEGVQVNDGFRLTGLLSRLKPYTRTIGFDTGMDHKNWGLAIQLDQFNPDYIYPLSTSSLFSDFNNIGILNSSDEIKASNPSCNLAIRSGWCLVHKPITDSQEEEIPVQQQISENTSSVKRFEYDFGKKLSDGQKNRLIAYGMKEHSLKREDILFGKQRCAIEVKNWKHRYAINNGALIRRNCPDCGGKTTVLCFDNN